MITGVSLRAAAALTGLKNPSHLHSVDADPSLIVDCNKSTPSPRSEGESGGQATPPPSYPLSTSYETASFVNADSSSVPSSTAKNDKDTALKGAGLSSNQTIIRNGSDIEDPQPKSPLSTRERAQSITYATRVSHGFVKGGIPMMPPPSQWARANGPKASLLERAIIDAHNYYGIYNMRKAQGKSLGRKSPIPVVLRANETPDQYEADLIRRMHPHTDVMKQRSQRINSLKSE